MKESQSGADRFTMMLWIMSSSLRIPKTSTSSFDDDEEESRSTSISWALPVWSERCLWLRMRGDTGRKWMNDDDDDDDCEDALIRV